MPMMIVLKINSRIIFKENSFCFLENESFDLDMEEYFAPPPPLSQSAPELNTALPEGPILRTAVSSTELLYERAMARFYKAVEFEETENARKRSISVDQETRRQSFSAELEGKRLSLQMDPQEAALMRLRINSLSESEKMSALKRRLSGDTPNLHINVPRKLSFKDDDDTQINTIRNELNTPEMIEKCPSPFAPPLAEGEAYSDDYTDSTESSDDEKNIATRRSRHRSNEMETYHPRMLSPYRQPENSEAAAVLTKPLTPLPDPNFVPKPILKRPASADGRRTSNKPERRTISQLFGGRRSASPSPARSPITHRKSVEIDEIPKIIQPREEIECIPKQKPKEVVQEVPEIKVEEPIPPEPEVEPEPEIIYRPSEQTKKKLMERRQSSLEENRVMADFYGDIIKDHSVRPMKPKVPIYMDPEALKKLEIEEDETQVDSGLNSSTDMSPQSTLSRPFSPLMGQTPIHPRGVSPTTFARRASELIKSPATDSVFERRFSETTKVKPGTSVLPLKDNLSASKLAEEKAPRNDRAELNKSPSPQKLLFTNGSVLQRHDGFISSTSSIDDVQSRGRIIKPKTGAIPKRRNQSQSRSRDNSSARSSLPTVTKSPMESTILTRRENSSSRTRNRSESKSPSTMGRRIIINRVAPPKAVTKEPTPTPRSRTATPSELQEEIQLKVKSTMTYVTDVSIFLFASYVYFFKSAILALPIVMLLLYRLLQDSLSDKIPDWMKRKKS